MLGVPSEVRSLELSGGDIISLNWTAPLPLDILGLDPAVSYRVSVDNSTSSATLHSECEITVTEFTYTLPPNADAVCDALLFTVTPVNVVGRGKGSTVQNGLREGKFTTENSVLLADLIKTVPQISDIFPSSSAIIGEVVLLMVS